MAGINVREQVIQEFTDSFNNKICEGNFLLVSMDRGKKEENILCIFKGAKRSVRWLSQSNLRRMESNGDRSKKEHSIGNG